jgi:type IV pilus assembly protein PilY1
MFSLNYKKWFVFGVACFFSANTCYSAIAQSPLFLTVSVDPNILFNMSVETPMGGAAYNDQPDGGSCAGRISDGGTVGICYFKTQKYLGYFDPNKCYVYDSTNGRFNPSSATINTDHECSGKYSGNFMNWATMTAMDMFVWTMTGGNRIVDNADNTTVVRRMRKQNNDSWFPYKLIKSASNVAPSTVTPWSDTKIFIYNTDFGVKFGTTWGGNEKGTMNVNVRVCDKTMLEANCIAYDNGNYYKPEGLIQKNADHMRFGVTSYSNTDGNGVDGGVLRSNIKYVGTLKPNGSGGTTDNTNKEIKADGTLELNSNPGDATASGVTKSGVIAYLNKFSDIGYKSNDPASELFYESVRYFKNLGPTAEYLTGATGTEDFPKLAANRWQDPILQRCQKNFIIGINDANPWKDKKLPGTFFTTSTLASFNNHTISDDYGQPSTPDTDINVRTLTNTVGDLQGISGTSQCIGCIAGNCTSGTTTPTATNKTIAHLGEVFGTCPAPQKENSYYIAGLAYYANTQDIRTSSQSRTDIPDKQTISTFMIDTQEYNTTPLTGQMNMLWLAGKYGGFTDKNGSNTPDLTSEWDIDADGEPDNYVLASEPEKLVTALNQAFSSIEKQISSASAVAANSTHLDTGTLIYQAKFDATDWSGELLALDINTSNGVVNTATPNWEASAKLPVHSSRNIYTFNPAATAGSRGIQFQWNNLTKDSDVPAPPLPSQQTYLNTLNGNVDTTKGTLRLSWLRGDKSMEQRLGGNFRNRIKQLDGNFIADTDIADSSIATNLLGDIVNSDPTFVGTQDFGYGVLPSPEGNDYSNTFRASSTYLNRRPMIYVGANDGMLHGFDAQKNGTGSPAITTGGTEVLAYIPNALFSQLSKLPDPNYGHQYFVDGPTNIGDAYIDADNNGTVEWHTLLAGTTGGGGRAVFALDVTYPDSFGASNVLWEFTNADDVDLGYTLTQPSIVRMKGPKWAVIVANGYNSDNGHAVLFIRDAKSGSHIAKIDTGIGDTTNKNGLSTPLPVDIDNDRIIDYIYAGDLYGNLWKFDVRSNDPSLWDVANKVSSVNTPLFTACSTTGTSCTSANRQPITSKPNIGQVGTNQTEGIMIYFGTGKYYESGDNAVGNSPQVHTFYGLWDKNTGNTNTDQITDRANLQDQSIDFEGFASTTLGATGSSLLRVTSSNTVCYSATTTGCTSSSPLKQGWALNLIKPTNIYQGERVVSAALVRRGLVIFSTLIPSSDPCDFGGTGWLMELDALTGKRSASPAFDVFGGTSLAPTTTADGKVDNADLVKIDNSTNTYTASGTNVGIGFHKGPAIVESDTVDYKKLSGSTGALGGVVDAGGGGSGGGSGTRKSWRQLR